MYRGKSSPKSRSRIVQLHWIRHDSDQTTTDPDQVINFTVGHFNNFPVGVECRLKSVQMECVQHGPDMIPNLKAYTDEDCVEQTTCISMNRNSDVGPYARIEMFFHRASYRLFFGAFRIFKLFVKEPVDCMRVTIRLSFEIATNFLNKPPAVPTSLLIHQYIESQKDFRDFVRSYKRDNIFPSSTSDDVKDCVANPPPIVRNDSLIKDIGVTKITDQCDCDLANIGHYVPAEDVGGMEFIHESCPHGRTYESTDTSDSDSEPTLRQSTLCHY